MYATQPGASHTQPSDTRADDRSGDRAKVRAQRRAEEKYQLFLESLSGRRPTGELLAEWGTSSAELSRIRATVRRAALVELSRGRGRPRKDNRLKAVHAEVERLNGELAEMALKVKLLSAKEDAGLVGPIRATEVPYSTRRTLVRAIEEACAAGMPVARACGILQLPRQRFYAWRNALAER